MRKSRVLLAGAAVAAAAVATSAFTASNTVPPSVAGYGQGLVTGAEVTDIHYVADPVDGTILDAVEFVTTTNVTNAETRTMTLKMDDDPTPEAPDGVGGDVVTGGVYDCDVKLGHAWDEAAMGQMTLTCDTTATTRNFEDFNVVGLTVIQ